MKLLYFFGLCSIFILPGKSVFGQKFDTTFSQMQQLPSGYIASVDAKVARMDSKITAFTGKIILRQQKLESCIEAKLIKVDSAASRNLFSSSLNTYSDFQKKILGQASEIINGIPGETYFPYLDTLKSALNFLNKYSPYLSGIKNAQQQLRTSLGRLNQLEYKMQAAQQIEQYLQQRQTLLQSCLSKYGKVFSRPLSSMDRNMYYYSAQIKAYKEQFQEPARIEAEGLVLLRNNKAFNSFMEKHSMLAGFFNAAQVYSSGNKSGLQTLNMVQNQIQTKVVGGCANGASLVTQQIQGAMSLLQQFKAKFPDLNSTAQMPDFKPNDLKTKSVGSRFVYGANIQFQRTTGLTPSIADIAVQFGYKINPKSEGGVGLAYLAGIGSNLRHISFSGQGISFRSYLDYKIKGTFYMEGGMERTYNRNFGSLHDLYQNVSVWTNSALLGLNKKYQVSSKVKGTLSLLYDFLHNDHIPSTPAFSFRMGYEF